MRYAWFARPNEIMLDFDNLHCTSEKVADKVERILDLYDDLMWERISAAESSSSLHFHVVIELGKEISPVEHARYAIACGSDPRREAANLDRARKGAEFPIALFRKDIPKGWRKPDLSCNCPWEIHNKKTGKMEKLHACVCIRTLRGHQYQAALKSNPKRISQAELKAIIAGKIPL